MNVSSRAQKRIQPQFLGTDNGTDVRLFVLRQEGQPHPRGSFVRVVYADSDRRAAMRGERLVMNCSFDSRNTIVLFVIIIHLTIRVFSNSSRLSRCHVQHSACHPSYQDDRLHCNHNSGLGCIHYWIVLRVDLLSKKETGLQKRPAHSGRMKKWPSQGRPCPSQGH